jgi:nitrite reductase/ring-hydroxylating ferredoxin subunit
MTEPATPPQPRQPPPGMRKYVVGRVADVPEGGRVIVEAGGREIGVFRINGAFYALLNRCPHLGGPLCQGQVVGEVFSPAPGDVRGNSERMFIACPWHNWEFDVRTGQSYWNPKGLRARPFPVGLEAGDAVTQAIESGTAERVKGPYAAETVPVGIEDDYLVLTLRPAPPRAAQRAAMEGTNR